MSMFVNTLLGRTTALALLLGAGAALYVVAIAPIHARYVEATERIATERLLLGRLGGEIARREAARPQGPAPARAASLANGAYLEGESEAVKSARLQAMVKDAAHAEGLRLGSVRALPVRDEAGLRLIGMEARLEASMTSLQRLLIALESRRPLLLIHGLQLTPAAARFASAGDAEAGEVLNIGIEIYGAAPGPRADAASPAPSAPLLVEEPADVAR